MHTETTNINDVSGAGQGAGRGVIFYDAGCGICAGGARWTDRFLARRGFALVPLQAPQASAMTGASRAALMAEVHLVTPAQRVLRGVDALLYVAGAISWALPLRWLARLPGAMPLLRRGYAWFARHRYGLSGACGIAAACAPVAAANAAAPPANLLADRTPLARPPRLSRVPRVPRVPQSPHLPAGAGGAPRPRVPLYPDRQTAEAIARWEPPAVAVMTALVAAAALPPWAYMWTLALTLYAACKWITWWPHRGSGSWQRSAAYLFAYAGMNAREFMSDREQNAAPGMRRYLFPVFNTLLGAAALMWLASRPALASSYPMPVGWAAMFAIALFCHFGLLNLLALLWRGRGIAAEPLMRAPIAATSLADFWGRRWNTGFRALTRELIFDPLARVAARAPRAPRARLAGRAGVTAATAAVFLASGLVHDLVISLPAGAGFGLPTLYFLIQLAGLLLERTSPLRRLIARHRAVGRTYAVLFTLAPLPLLFHAAFVERCIIPFLHAIGGLS